MKKLIVLLFLSSCSILPYSYTDSEYNIHTKEIEDINGKWNYDLFLLKKEKKAPMLTCVYIGSSSKLKFIEVKHYNGDWRWIKGLNIKTDTSTYYLIDDDPSRIVISGLNDTCEKLVFEINEKLMTDLLSTNTLKLEITSNEYVSIIFKIPQIGVQNLKKFLIK